MALETGELQNLKRTNTKEFTGEAMPEDVARFAKLYSDCRGTPRSWHR